MKILHESGVVDTPNYSNIKFMPELSITFELCTEIKKVMILLTTREKKIVTGLKYPFYFF